MRVLVLTVCLALSQAVLAQVGLPAVRLPQLPAGGLPNLPDATLPSATGALTGVGELDPRRLQQLRALRIRELLGRHRDVLEADPHGAPIVRGEVLSLAPSAAALEAAAAAGFPVLRDLDLEGLGLRIVVLHASSGTARALERMQALDPAGTYDFNHVYTASAATVHAAQKMSATQGGSAATGTRGNAASGATAAEGGVSVGLIDSGVDVTHEVFRDVPIERHGCAGRAVPDEHGTAVASLMVGRAAALHGAAPGAALYAADVFCGRPTGGAVDAVAEGFAWLVQQHVPVINVSLVGPPDRLLERVVEAAVKRGYVVVAAVGNDGPAAPPLYPAAWPGVVGVTAVDARGRGLIEAERGPQVKFAAPGADLAAARVRQGYALVRGTSFAAPLVAGLLALTLHAPDRSAAEGAIAALARSAQHAGAAQGFDPIYGYGVVGAELRRQPALAALRRN